MKNVSAAQQVHSLDEVGAATMCQWAEAEGWNPGIHDASTFWNSDPQGFFGLSAEGQLVGTISAVRYGDEFAFVGFFIVRPGSRGHLLGQRQKQAQGKLIRRHAPLRRLFDFETTAMPQSLEMIQNRLQEPGRSCEVEVNTRIFLAHKQPGLAAKT